MNRGNYLYGVVIVSLITLGLSCLYWQSTNVITDLALYNTNHYTREVKITTTNLPPVGTVLQAKKRRCPVASYQIGPVVLESCDGHFAIRTSAHNRYIIFKSGGYAFFTAPILAWLGLHLPRNTIKFHGYIIATVLVWLLLMGGFLAFSTGWSFSAGAIALLFLAASPTINLALCIPALTELLTWTSFIWTLYFLARYRNSQKTLWLILAFACMGFGMSNKFTFIFLTPLIIFSGLFPGRVGKRESIYAILAFIVMLSPHLIFFSVFPAYYISGIKDAINSTLTKSNLHEVTNSIPVFLEHVLYAHQDPEAGWLRAFVLAGLHIYAFLKGDKKIRWTVAVSWATVTIIVCSFVCYKGAIRFTRAFDMWPMVVIPAVLGASLLWQDLKETRLNVMPMFSFFVVSVLVIVTGLIIGYHMPKKYSIQAMPLAKTAVQQRLFEALEKYHVQHPMLFDYNSRLAFCNERILDYASGESIQPLYTMVDRVPESRYTAQVLRLIKPEGPIVLIWLEPGQGLSLANRKKTRRFISNMLQVIPHKTLDVLDDRGDKLIEFCPGKSMCPDLGRTSDG